MKLETAPRGVAGPDARKFVTGYLGGLGLNFFSLNWKVIGVEAWKFQRVITGDVADRLHDLVAGRNEPELVPRSVGPARPCD